ncbi:hypothetical protein [Micromonospora sp. CMU55-4]|uniref:hypothetical protein n=1 Tax=Micromonospora sp. CMU55-4 TaxID=2717028 RepID=UPI00140B48E4|nr:hypothetical protein [Micromonospora sp. CMU55-4]NHO84948.1 hypothetical protein [Micromonospora sp. CMU55-4]
MDVLALAYAQRQLIVVQRDEEILAHRRRPAAASGSDQTVAVTSDKDSKNDGFSFPLHLFLTRPAVALAVAGAVAAVGAAVALKQSSSPGSSARRVLRLRTAEIAGLQLPLGHPLFDTVYVGHPARPAAYYPLADFHRRAFEHKFSEALRLVTSLGATSIKVSAVQGWGREFSAGLRVALPAADSVGAKVANQESRNREFLYSAELDGSAEPVIPPDLVWYPHEDAWQEIARQRIKHGLRSFELQVTYKDDFSVTSELAADVSKANFKLGGEFQRQQSTIWAINGTFAQ